MGIETFETEVDVLAADMLWQDETSKHEGNNKRKAESTIHLSFQSQYSPLPTN